MIQHRRVVYLDNETWTRLKDESAAQKRTISDIVRERVNPQSAHFEPTSERASVGESVSKTDLAGSTPAAHAIARMTQAQRDKILKGKG